MALDLFSTFSSFLGLAEGSKGDQPPGPVKNPASRGPGLNSARSPSAENRHHTSRSVQSERTNSQVETELTKIHVPFFPPRVKRSLNVKLFGSPQPSPVGPRLSS